MLNAGILEIYQKKQAKSSTGMALRDSIEFVSKAFYGEIGFTVQEYYEAKQANSQIVKRVRIHQDTTLGNNHVIVVGGVQYDVGRTYSAVHKGVAITDITLEKVTTQYGITKPEEPKEGEESGDGEYYSI